MDDLQYLARKKDTRLDLVGKTVPIKRARTYLPEGQHAPEGSEEQEGPRGGRYYEDPGSTPGELGEQAGRREAAGQPTGDEEAEADTGRGPTEMEQLRAARSGEERDRIIDGLEDEELEGAYRDLLETPSQGDTPLLEELDQEYQRRGYEPGAVAGQGGLGEAEDERDQQDVEGAEADTGKEGLEPPQGVSRSRWERGEFKDVSDDIASEVAADGSHEYWDDPQAFAEKVADHFHTDADRVRRMLEVDIKHYEGIFGDEE